MVKIFRILIYYVTYPYYYLKEKQRIKKRLEELRKQDPFIYK